MKHHENQNIEDAIATALIERLKHSLAVPRDVSVNFDAFAQMVTRLNAKVHEEADSERGVTDRWVQLHTAAGRVHIHPSTRVPFGELELERLPSFVVGDVVRLNTGGPLMTVEHVHVASYTFREGVTVQLSEGDPLTANVDQDGKVVAP